MGKRFTEADIARLQATGRVRVMDHGKQDSTKVKEHEPVDTGRFFTGWNQDTCTIFIGVDSGVKTGLAIWNSTKGKFDWITTTTITRAMEICKQYKIAGHRVTVRVEDARQRKWFGEGKDTATRRQQGAGSVKRDASVWESHLQENGIPYEMVHPVKGATKLSKEQFLRTTGYTGITSVHGRDAAMLVYKM
ncbi:MAG: hypothetical protein KF744_09140 [Taibaiella sp.]|nr:hypothetical protein [Taibaiella sp.]